MAPRTNTRRRTSLRSSDPSASSSGGIEDMGMIVHVVTRSGNDHGDEDGDTPYSTLGSTQEQSASCDRSISASTQPMSSSGSSSAGEEDDDDDQQSVSSFHSTHTHAMEMEDLSARSTDSAEPGTTALGSTSHPDQPLSAPDQPPPTSTSKMVTPESNHPPDEGCGESAAAAAEASEGPSTQVQERQIVPFQTTDNQNTAKSDKEDDEEELQLIGYASSPPNHNHQHRRSASRMDLSATSQHLVPYKPLDPKEEERRRTEVNAAMEILEHMRRANLVMEFGPGVDLDACVFCLREERKNHNGNSHSKKQPNNANPLHDLLPKNWKLQPNKQCLICHTPVCKNHWDSGFLHQQNVILCQDCAPLFDLDNLVECMNLNNKNTTDATDDTDNDNDNTTSVQQQQEQHMRQLLVVYDRALLALRHSSQSFDDKARRQLAQTSWHKEGLGIGSHVTNIASGVTGIAATAVFMTPMGPWLLLTSLALGGIATAVGSGSFLVEKLCPQTRQAEQTIALASMVDSLLEATTILRRARITGALQLPASADQDDDDETELGDDDDLDLDLDDDDISIASFKSLPRLPPSTTAGVESGETSSTTTTTTMYLQEDKEQRLMITILKAKMDAETRAANPLQAAMKKINRHVKDQQRKNPRLRQRRMKKDKWRNNNNSNSNNAATGGPDDPNAQEEEEGPLKKISCRVRNRVSRAKQQAGEAVVVARTATALAAVGMSEGGVGFIRRFGGRRARARGAAAAGTAAKSATPTKSTGTDDTKTTTSCNSDSYNNNHDNETPEASDAGNNNSTKSNETEKEGEDDKNPEEGAAATAPDEVPPQQRRKHSFIDEMTAAGHGLQFFARNLFNPAALGDSDDKQRKQKDGSSSKKDGSISVVRQPSIKNVNFPFKNVLIRVFLRRNTAGTTPGAPSNERALVAEIQHKNIDLKLRASDQAMQAFTRTNVKVAKQQGGDASTRQRILAGVPSDEADGLPASNQVFVKNARFLVKASLTVLRETARYAGGAFSAAIVCVETMELQEKVKRIRGRGVRCSNADKLEQLKHHLWENEGTFPDTMTLEWELSGNAKGEIVETCDGDGNNKSAVIPHWSSAYQGQRPDGSCANLPIMEDSLTVSQGFGYVSNHDLTTPYQLH